MTTSERNQNNTSRIDMFSQLGSNGVYGLGNIGRIAVGDDRGNPPNTANIPNIPQEQSAQTVQYVETQRKNKRFSGFNYVSEDALSFPAGSLQRTLELHAGYFVVCDFLIGTQNIVTRYGVLYDVGSSYIVLLDDITNRYTVCDLSSLKFITFFNSMSTPANFRGIR